MAKKKKPEKSSTAPAVTRSKKTAIPYWILPFILLVTFVAFIPALQAGFVNWDDPSYVKDNLLIRDLFNFKALLTTPVLGNYHPLTMFTLAINYAISGADAWSYHLFNLLLHLANCILVFRLALLLSNKNIIIAFTTALLFGIHPMHVESVAWVSERKDVLYGLFFLAGLISYTKYADTGSKKHYLCSMLFLILALISKPAAVIFPAVLFGIDGLRKRKFNARLLLEKVPFFLFAVIMGLLTLKAQKDVGATSLDVFSFGTKILFGFYGIMTYFLKMLIPVNLSPFYPLPPLNEKLAFEYYLAPFFFIALAILLFYSWKKNRLISFGIFFYLVNLLLVLQIISVGSAIIADRYTYIPYIGLFFIIGWLIHRYARTSLAKANFIIIPVALILGIVTFRQAGVWHDGASLWDHAIKTQPSSKAYVNRAILLKRENNIDLALEYFNKAIRMNVLEYEAFNNRGNIYFNRDQLDLAYADYRKALSIKPDYLEALDNMGAQFAKRGQLDSAMKYHNKAIAKNPGFFPAYLNRGLTHMALNKYEEAIKDFKKHLEYQPDADDYNSIGICYQRMGKYQESITYIDSAIKTKLNPVFYLNRSYNYYFLKNLDQARKDALAARQQGVALDPSYAASLGIQ